jgi:PKD repeat protein
LVITASPDVLSMDGASQSRITIEARDANGQLSPNVQLRMEIQANGQLVDFGSLSARTVVTAANGRASVTYTAPQAVQGSIPTLSILITPGGTDAAGAISRSVSIRLVPPGVITGGGPTPSFTVTPANPAAFADALFDASASTAPLGASIVGYSWSFGDGSSATGVTTTHRYGSSATFRATLTVTDSNGVSSSTSQNVVVGSGTSSIADFTFSPTAPSVNQQINFNGGLSTAGAGHTIVKYDWNFGSGSPQSGITVSKTYDVAGTYNVTLTTTDEAGQTAQATKSVTVSSAAGGGSSAAISQFTFSPSAPGVGETVFFNASTSTAGTGHTIASYAWTFGDGATGTGIAPTHSYSTAGTYSVQLKLTDETGQTTTSSATTISVGSPPAPTANFTYSPLAPYAGQQVVFDASSSTTAQGQTIVDVAWNFGDGTAVIHCGTLFGNDPSCVNVPATNRISAHTYASAGSWVVNLVVTDSAGRTGSKFTSVPVAPNTPTARLTLFKNGGNNITADGSASTAVGGASIVTYNFDFGDGTSVISGAAVVPHAYAAPGTYVVTLTVTDNNVPPRTGTITASVTVP